jgi:hypothetical protein
MTKLTKIKGKDYLEVKWRLVWLRDSHPDAIVRTEVLEYDRINKFAHVKATIIIPGGAEATGHKQEDAAGFGDYLEKAETGAVGRALAMLGFGTQFAEELEIDSIDDPVDSPVTPTPIKEEPPTGNQKELTALFARCTELGIDKSQTSQWVASFNLTSHKDVPAAKIRALLSDFRNPANVERFKEKYPHVDPPQPIAPNILI